VSLAAPRTQNFQKIRGVKALQNAAQTYGFYNN
jgi:hypothetical protein